MQREHQAARELNLHGVGRQAQQKHRVARAQRVEELQRVRHQVAP